MDFITERISSVVLGAKRVSFWCYFQKQFFIKFFEALHGNALHCLLMEKWKQVQIYDIGIFGYGRFF